MNRGISFRAFALVVVAAAVLLGGCAVVAVEGDRKVATTSMWFTGSFVAAALAGAVACWVFRQRSALNWLGVVGLPIFAVYIVVAGSQLKGIVDPEHFELQSVGNKYSVRFDELTRMTVVELNEGKNHKGIEQIRYYVDLKKKDGSTQRIQLGDTMKPLWSDIVAKARAAGAAYDDNYGYLQNPR